jgi:tetratricopeptide (TPR) repeat protein
MRLLAALILTGFTLFSWNAHSQDTVFDWSKKVIELQSKEGQNFEQDLILLRGYLSFNRRTDALMLIQKMNRIHARKDIRLTELTETASEQFFFQETAELHSEALQLMRDENWSEAKEKLESALQKEPGHRLLLNRVIQTLLALEQSSKAADWFKIAEGLYPETGIDRIYRSWIGIQQQNAKDSIRPLSNLWYSDRKFFERNEAALLAFMKATELNKYQLDVPAIQRMIQKHPEWWCARLMWVKSRWNSKPIELKKELLKISKDLEVAERVKVPAKKDQKGNLDPFVGLVSKDGCKKDLNQSLSAISETK